jgi:hypothetical protein
MAASRSLNEPVVMITFAAGCAANGAFTMIANSSTNKTKKSNRFSLMASSDEVEFRNRPEVNEIVSLRQVRVLVEEIVANAVYDVCRLGSLFE